MPNLDMFTLLNEMFSNDVNEAVEAGASSAARHLMALL